MVKRFLLLSLLSFGWIAAADQRTVFIEGGAVWQHRNDVQIPPDTGTRVEFDEFNEGPFLHYRLNAKWGLTQKHGLRLVLAPLQISVQGETAENIIFNDVTFSANDEITVNYKFDSYRLGYYYAFWGQKDSQLNLGFTLKLRDAFIEFKQGNSRSKYDNQGFVPLVYFEYQTPVGSKWLFNLNTDFAAAPQGRAVDLALKLRRKVSDATTFGLGLRTLEGGADNDKVFTFSWLNYATLELGFSF